MIRTALPQCDAFDWIYDPDGSPDVDKLVTLVKVVDASDRPISFEQRHTFTDQSGQYHFTLPQGSTVWLQARASGLWADNGPIAFAVPNAPSGQLIPTTVPEEIVGVMPPLILDGSTLSIPRASTTQDGYLAAEDFALFAEGGAVREVDTGAGLTGGPINADNPEGTIALAPVPGLTPGTYYGPGIIQIDAYGRVVGIAGTGDTTAPVISAVAASSITTTSAIITWTTNEQSDSLVEYGTTTSYGSPLIPNTALVTSHTWNITGLTPATLYHFRVTSKDISGNAASSGDFTFTTTSGAGDTTPPVISSVISGSITTTGATITWTTDEASDSQVEYGTTTAYGSSTTLDPALVTSHSQPLTGLAVGTLYHFRVKSKDAASNMATSSDFTFTTTAALTERQSLWNSGNGIEAPLSGSLATGLVAYWNCNGAAGATEPSATGTATDLAALAAPGSAAGKVAGGTSRTFVAASSQALFNSTNTAAFSPGNASFTIAGWVYLSDKVNQHIITKTSARDVAPDPDEYIFQYSTADDLFELAFHTGPGVYRVVKATSYGSPPISTWIFVVFWFDASARTMNIQINNGAVDSLNIGTEYPTAGTASFQLGAYAAGLPGAAYWNGRLDAVGYWSRILT